MICLIVRLVLFTFPGAAALAYFQTICISQAANIGTSLLVSLGVTIALVGIGTTGILEAKGHNVGQYLHDNWRRQCLEYLLQLSWSRF